MKRGRGKSFDLLNVKELINYTDEFFDYMIGHPFYCKFQLERVILPAFAVDIRDGSRFKENKGWNKYAVPWLVSEWHFDIEEKNFHQFIQEINAVATEWNSDWFYYHRIYHHEPSRRWLLRGNFMNNQMLRDKRHERKII